MTIINISTLTLTYIVISTMSVLLKQADPEFQRTLKFSKDVNARGAALGRRVFKALDEEKNGRVPVDVFAKTVSSLAPDFDLRKAGGDKAWAFVYDFDLNKDGFVDEH